MRSLYFLASSSLCVTTITNDFSLAFLSDSITNKALFLSRAPVGSSANKRRGSLMKARIIAILSLSPPDSIEHFLSNKDSSIEKSFISDKAFLLEVAKLSPFNKQGSMMLYKALWLSKR